MIVTEMKAVQYSGYGGGPAALKHVNIPVPTPKKGELLVKVEAAGVNPLDWKINDGMMRPVTPSKFPHTPGIEIAGEVVGVGAGVEDYVSGDRVVSILDMNVGGGLAEYAIARPKFSAKIPPQLSGVEGASLAVAGLAGLQSLTNSGVNIDGSYTGNVLITGAAGGVGLTAIQLAKVSGAHLTVTVGERNIELVKGLGADEVLDYKSEEGKKLISPSGKKYDVVVNCANSKWATIQPQLSATGEVQELSPVPSVMASSLFKKIMMSKQRRTPFFMAANDKDLTFLVGLVTDGKLKTFVDSKFPLDKAEDAWTKSKVGHPTGKVVVTMVDE